jgi:hypothetical protein
MNIFKITEEEKRKILNSHKSELIVKEQANAFDKFKKEFPSSITQSAAGTTQPAAAPAAGTTQPPAAPAAGTTQPPAAPAASTEKKFEFKTDPNVKPESGIKYQPPTPQELSKGVQMAATAATAAPTTPAVKGNPMVAKLQQTLIDKFKVNLGNTGPNGNGVDGFMGINTANAIKKALELSKAAPNAEVATKTDTTQQKKVEFKAPNITPESGIKYQPPTAQELAKGVQMAAVKK